MDAKGVGLPGGPGLDGGALGGAEEGVIALAGPLVHPAEGGGDAVIGVGGEGVALRSEGWGIGHEHVRGCAAQCSGKGQDGRGCRLHGCELSV